MCSKANGGRGQRTIAVSVLAFHLDCNSHLWLVLLIQAYRWAGLWTTRLSCLHSPSLLRSPGTVDVHCCSQLWGSELCSLCFPRKYFTHRASSPSPCELFQIFLLTNYLDSRPDIKINKISVTLNNCHTNKTNIRNCLFAGSLARTHHFFSLWI